MTSGERWVETTEGGLFFVNALLAAPELVVLVPLGMKAMLRSLGLVGEASVYFDTFPMLAGYVLPWAGWLLAIPIWTTVRNLRMETPRWASAALLGFLAVHVSFLAWTVGWWITGGNVPGAP